MAIGDIETVERKYHAKYGPLVRLAPNEVSCNSPAAIPLIYRERNPLSKSPWYKTFRPQGISSQADLFTETDEEKHSQYRKIVGQAYAMGSILKNESQIDDCISLFIKRLREFAARKQSFDFGHWLEMLAYDLIGRVMYGQMLGFLENGTDVGRWMSSVTHALPLLHIAAAGPSYMITPVMILAMCIPGMAKNFAAVGEITTSAKRITTERMKEDEEARTSKTKHDILSQLFTILRTRGSTPIFSHREITLEAWTGIIAGADSTATTMRAVLYYLIKYPHTLTAAMAEIDKADKEGLLSSPIQYAETIARLPYICACIKEALRLFPSFATRMRRVSPTAGMEICGRYLPGGTIVGMNAAVVQYSTSIFGVDAESFRPERWMDSTETNFRLEKGMLVFGAGTRTCTGRNIAMVEVHKVVPEVLRRFEVSMAHGREWKTWNAGFIRQSDVVVNLKIREME